MADQDQLPLQGAVLCCTSIPPEQRSTLAGYATQMGAVHRLDLTSDVTHLLVGAVETAKYKYVAKERPDIKVLLPEWIEAVRDAWVQADAFDLEELERQWKVPTLYGLRICVTGFDDVAQRSELQRVIAANGAEYHGDLTKAVSHLVAKEPSGKKYEYAGQWRINIVSLDWLRDSLSRGLALEERSYHPLVPPAERGRDAQVRMAEPTSPRTLKRARETSQRTRVDSGPRKLRRTASTRLGSQHGDLWADMGNSAAVVSHAVAGNEQGSAQSHLNDSSNSMSEHNSATEQQVQQENQTQTQSGEIFDGARVHISHFDARKTGILQNHLQGGGAIIVSQSELEHRSSAYGNLRSLTCKMPVAEQVIIILPHNLANALELKSEITGQPYISPQDTFSTDLWVEKCIFRKSMLDPSGPLCQSFTFPIPGFEKLIVCPTSFTGIDLLHLSKTVPLLGAKYDETLRPSTSVLVCASSNPNPAKLRYALQHRIPVVEAEWFYASVAASELKPFEQFMPPALRKLQQSSSSANPEGSGQRRPPAGGHSGRTSSDQESHKSQQPTSRRQQKPSTDQGQSSKSPNSGVSHRTEATNPPVLREIPPNSSPPKQRRSKSRSPSKHASGPPLKPKQSEQTKVALSDALAQLLASRKEKSTEQASASSLHAATAASGIPAPPLRHRKLGRATSNPSSMSSRGQADALLESYDSALAGDPDAATAPAHALFRPSQAVSYEDPEALAAREKLMRRMGGASLSFKGDGDGGDHDDANAPGDDAGRMKVVAKIGVVSREAHSAAAAVGGAAASSKKRLRKR